MSLFIGVITMSMLGSVQELEDEKMADAYALALAKVSS
jgi:hypothetical protein